MLMNFSRYLLNKRGLLLSFLKHQAILHYKSFQQRLIRYDDSIRISKNFTIIKKRFYIRMFNWKRFFKTRIRIYILQEIPQKTVKPKKTKKELIDFLK